MTNDTKKYWQNMDEESAAVPAPNTSWIWGQLMDMVSLSGTVETTPSEGSATQDEEHAAPTKPVLRRASTTSTVLDSMHFTASDEPGWEVTLDDDERSCRDKIKASITSHPKRFGICTVVTLLVIVLVSVLCATSRAPATDNSPSAGTTSGHKKPDKDNSTTTTTDGGDDTAGNQDADDADDTTGDQDDTDDADDTTPTTVDLTTPAPPFSTLDPVEDLELFGVVHTRGPPDSVIRSSDETPVPTNAWYQNLLVVPDGEEPSGVHKAYVIPYLVDAVGPVAGLRLHSPYVTATSTTVQSIHADKHGLTLGVAGGEDDDSATTKAYSVVSTNQLGLTLQWNANNMTSSIVRGMPYATMHYPKPLLKEPIIASEVGLENAPLADNATMVVCGGPPMQVNSTLRLEFQSDFTWMVYVSEPILLECDDDGDYAQFKVVGLVEEENDDASQLTIRAALLTNCTNGNNANYCQDGEPRDSSEYEVLLNERAHLYPGPNADIRYDVDHTNGKALLRLDWDVQDMSSQESHNEEAKLIMYALPHQWSRKNTDNLICTSSLLGPTCIWSGKMWDLQEDLPITSFRAPRPPKPEALPMIADALARDIAYQIPDNVQRGAGDTYFSGKILARVGRVLLIAEELQDLCDGRAVGYDLTDDELDAYVEACKDIELPSEDDFAAALAMLRSSTEVWINGEAEAPFAYDSAWGGVISCGCIWNGGGCSNTLPDCPATYDQGLNFGNGFYNDHHFHYGYHIAAAAALAHFDQEWAREHFENVLLLVRDIANPSTEDPFFPRFRNKDWYQGSSWANGVTLPTFANGMNQESSSEAIAAYEAVALYGKEMIAAWKAVDDTSQVQVCEHVRDTGMVMAATEILSVDYYWHIRRNDGDSLQIYPEEYEARVVGILWSESALFTTWFGNAPYLMYGIQLLPLTPISENRDASQAWLREMYGPLAESCAADANCVLHGWSILQLAMLASIGNVDMALEAAQQIPSTAFASAGGNGHSMTNTLHYMATRPDVTDPMDVDGILQTPPVLSSSTTENTFERPVDCGTPDSCTTDVLDTMAKGHLCRDRIVWLMDTKSKSEMDACRQVAEDEFPDECGACVPPQNDNV